MTINWKPDKIRLMFSVGPLKNICCVFWQAFGYCVHLKAGRNTFFSFYQLDFRCEITEKALEWTKKVENGKKKCFEQLLVACSTQKLVEIHNTLMQSVVFNHCSRDRKCSPNIQIYHHHYMLYLDSQSDNVTSFLCSAKYVGNHYSNVSTTNCITQWGSE